MIPIPPSMRRARMKDPLRFHLAVAWIFVMLLGYAACVAAICTAVALGVSKLFQ